MFNHDKAINLVLFVVKSVPDPGLHKVFKLLYFADREHLKLYGTTISSDKYISMKDGPVPSSIYDILKIARGDYMLPTPEDFKEFVKRCLDVVSRYKIIAKENPNLDYLSESEIECLIFSIEKYKNLSFEKLKQLSHDFAWEQAQDNNEMSILNIAKAGGASQEMLDYIGFIAENEKMFA